MSAVACAALVLWALPVVTLWLRRIGRGGGPAGAALDVALAVALDVLLILALCRLTTLDRAAVLSRIGWAAAFAVVAWRRRRALRSPVAARGSAVGALLAAGALAIGLGSPFSHGLAIWDRPLHAPLVTALGGQLAPFEHVYSPGAPLRYHLAGDVVAATLRALSGNSLSSGAALSLAHDALLVLCTLSVGLFVAAFAPRRVVAMAVGGALLLLHGPLPLHGAGAESFQGYAYHLFFSVSYRPHVPVAALMMVGIVGLVVAWAVGPPGRGNVGGAGALLAMGAVLGLSDEASLGLVGLGLGAGWLASPRLLGRTRLRGALRLAAFGTASLGGSLLLGGSLGPGGPVQALDWLREAAYPSVLGGQIPLASVVGLGRLVVDTAGWLVGLGVLVGTWRAGRAQERGLAIMATTVVAGALVIATHLRVNGSAAELQRMFVAPAFVTLLPALLLLDRLPRRSLGRPLLWLGLGLPAAGSLYWLLAIAPGYTAGYREGPTNVWATESTYGIDCRAVAGARLGQQPEPSYVDERHHYLWSSCRPIFGPGRVQPPWTMATLPEFESRAQLRALHEALGPAELSVFCAADGPADRVCTQVRWLRPFGCIREGEQFVRCSLSAAERAGILGPTRRRRGRAAR